MTTISRNKYLIYIYCVLLALAGLCLYSYSTMPIYSDMKGQDSSVFQLIGREWAHGHLPYITLWDNKGPIIYLIDCLGYMLTGNSFGIFLIQFVSLSLTLAIIYRILSLAFSFKQSALLLLLPVMSLVFNGWVGNNVEEYLLPLLSASYLLVCKWLADVEENRSVSHPPLYAFVYGMTFSFCTLTRLTNVIGIASCVLIILVYLILHRQWSNICKNAILFILGFTVLTAPFVLYFWSKGALTELINSSLLINIKFFYSSGIDNSLKGIIYILLHFMDTWLILATGIIMLLLSKRRFAAVMWTCTGLSTTLWILHSYAFSHYGVISLPLVAIAMVELRRVYEERESASVRRYIAVIAGMYILAISLCFVVYRTHYFLHPPVNPELAIYRRFMKDVPATFRHSFVGYNIRADYYLYDNITPSCRFFACQDIQPDGLGELTTMKQEAFRNGVEWIMVKNHAVIISQILKENYTLVKCDKAHGLSLYHIKGK